MILNSTLAVMDDNGDKRLTKDELKYGLQDYGIELNIREMDEIFNYFGMFSSLLIAISSVFTNDTR